MAMDYQGIVRDLLNFYDLGGRKIISVGAGGGQFVEYGRHAGHVIAVDCDATAAAALSQRLEIAGLSEKFTVVVADFLQYEEAVETVLFEFSLHEMPDPDRALDHARTLAPDIIVMDHGPSSPWVHYIDEEEKVRAAWKAIERHVPSRRQEFAAFQSFHDFQELYDKVKGQGETALRRIAPFRLQKDFQIPATYAFAHMSGIVGR